MANASTSTVWPVVPGTTATLATAFQGGTTFSGAGGTTGSVVNLNHNLGLPAAPAAAAMHFLYDFYNRIYITPNIVNFGAISGSSTAVVQVWNAYLAPNTLTTIAVTNGVGISIGGPPRPRAFAALEVVEYSLTASLDGPATINAQFQFQFTNGSASVSATGSRSLVWPFPPNWRAGVQDSREFRTEIIVSESGREQRRAARTTPRRRIEFTSQVTGERLRALVRLLNRSQNRTMLIPDWMYYATTTAITTGDTATVDAMPEWMVADETVIFWGDGVFEARTVESVAGNTVTFTGANMTWPAGTRIYRALRGLLGTEIQTSLPTNAVATVPVSFSITPGSEPPVTPPAPTAMLGDYEVFERNPNWGDSVQSMFSMPISTVDYGRGLTTEFRPVKFGTTTRRGTYYGMTRADLDALVGTFYRAKGRRGEFYFPSGLNDLTLRTTWPANNALLRVIGVETASAYETDTVNRAVAIYLNSGAVYYRQVEEIYAFSDGLGNDSMLRLTTGLPITIEPADVLRISWMPRHRFGSDVLNINWLTDEVAEVPMSFTSLENLAGN